MLGFPSSFGRCDVEVPEGGDFDDVLVFNNPFGDEGSHAFLFFFGGKEGCGEEESESPIFKIHEACRVGICSFCDRSFVHSSYDLSGEVDHAVGVAPFVVVPDQEFELGSVDHHGGGGVDDSGAGVVEVVGGDEGAGLVA